MTSSIEREVLSRYQSADGKILDRIHRLVGIEARNWYIQSDFKANLLCRSALASLVDCCPLALTPELPV